MQQRPTIYAITDNNATPPVPTAASEAFKPLSGLMFSGDDYIETPALPVARPTSTTPFEQTYSAWIYIENANSSALILGDTNQLMQLELKQNKVTLTVRFADGLQQIQEPNPVPLNQWTHYTGVVTSDPIKRETVLTLYQQGEQVSTQRFTGKVLVPAFRQTKLVRQDAQAGDMFGSSVAIAGDTVIVGVPYDDDRDSDAGSAYVFQRTNGGWSQVAKLRANDAQLGDVFGSSVAIAGDTVIVGASGDDDRDTGVGSAYVFQRTDGRWSQVAKLRANDGRAADGFGASVAIAGDTVIVGASGNDDQGRNAGSAYVFQRTDGKWSQVAKLRANDGRAADVFGSSVAIAGDTVIVGASGDDARGTDAGSVYVFQHTDGKWSQVAKLRANDGQAEDRFGSSVAIAGDTAIVGASGNDDQGRNAGSAYVFQCTNSGWSQVAKLRANDAQAGDWFGSSVAIAGDTAIVGARGDDDGGADAGSAYVFQRMDGRWSQVAKLLANDGQAADVFGASVAIAGDTVIVGAWGDDDKRTDAGSIYIFDLSSKFFIGRSLNGIISGVCFWNRALLLAEIQQLRLRSPIGTEAGLVGYWSFTQVSQNLPNQLPEHTVHKNPGVVHGNPQTRTWLQPTHNGRPVIAYSSDDLQPVDSQTIYREFLELKLSPSVPVISNLFQFQYWGKASQTSERRITEGFTKVAEKIEPLNNGWHRATCCFTVPEKVKLVRAFEISLNKGGSNDAKWEAISIRNHRIEKYRDILSFYLKFNPLPQNSTKIVEIGGEQQQGTLHGVTIKPDTEFGYCAVFEGNAYISFANPQVPVQNEPYTIEAWIKPDAMGDSCIVGWGDPSTNHGANLLKLTPTGIRNSWDQRNTAHVAQNTLTDGQWHHIAATFDGKTCHVYIDGDGKKKATDQPERVLNSQQNFYIGKSAANDFFKGKIALIRIWGRALTLEEIDRYRQLDRLAQKKTLTDPNLQLHLRLNELRQGLEPGTHEVHDFSGQERHGLIKNAQAAPELIADDHFGSCLRFNKDSSAIAVTTIPQIPTNQDFTITLAVKPEKAQGATILQWGDALKIVQKGETWELSLKGTQPIIFDATAKLGKIVDGNWHHLAITFNRQLSEISVYFDQEPVAFKTASLDVIGSSQSLEIAPER